MRVLKMVVYGSCVLALMLGCLLIGKLQAESPALIISELKVRNDTAGYDEFIELYNPGSQPVSLNDYFIGYVNTPTPNTDQVPSRAVIAQGQLVPGHYYLLAKNELDARLSSAQKIPFSSLADSGGTVDITDSNGNQVDAVHWTASSVAAVNGVIYMPGTTAAKSQAITRSKTPQGAYIVTPAVWQLATPTPEGSSLLPLLIANTDPVDQTGPPTNSQTEPPGSTLDPTEPSSDGGESAPISWSKNVEISELLPNPAAPETDEADEYIELHNLSDQPLNLKDYKLQAGNNFTYSYTFPEHFLAPGTYEAFKVSTTHLLLSNSGGRSRLLSPNGEVVSQTDAYGNASAGLAWALIDDSWQWTNLATPAAPNVISAIGGSTKATSITKKVNSAPKQSKPVPKTSTKAVKATKVTTAKAKTANTPKKNNLATNTKNSSSNVPSVAKLHPIILAGVGVSTVLYGLYEYRQDIGNTLRRLRGNRSIRRALGSQTQGPGGD